MKIAFLTQYYPPETGAPQARISELASHFVARGHRVGVLTAMPNYPQGRIYDGYNGLIKREVINGISVLRTFVYPTQKADIRRRLASYSSFVLSSALVGTVLLQRPDYLFVESPPLFLGIAGYWLSRIKRTRMIFNVSDLWPQSVVELGVIRSGSLAERLSSRLESFCYRSAWLISAQSQGILNSIRKRFPEARTFHLSNGADTRRFDPELKSECVRASLGEEGQIVVLYAGLHGIAQGLEYVIEAARLLKDDRRFSFVLIGDGPEKERLQQKASEYGLRNISFRPPQPSGKIPELLASADILLVTLKLNLTGAVPSKLYEAMASARPVVLMAVGEAATIVTTTQAGLVVEPGDVDGLIQALVTLADDAEFRTRAGANGRKAAESEYDRTRIATAFMEYLAAG